MLRSVLWTLRQRRYALIAVLMVFVAGACVAAGTWQIQRFEQSVRDNRALDHNAGALAVPLSTSLAPLVGTAPKPGRDAVRFRTITTSGTYFGSDRFVDGKSSGSTEGFDVVTPLRTSDGVLLVVRGFVAADGNGQPGAVQSPPSGTVHLTGRLDTASSGTGPLGVAAAASTLGQPVYGAILNLNAHQPGTSGLKALPKPDLSNPAGGAYEAQHFAYIIQWYLFALIALVTPFALARNEVRDAQRRFLGIDTGEEELSLSPRPGVRPEALTAGASSSGDSGAEIALRSDGTLVSPGARAELEKAKRLADRYGRSLSYGDDIPAPKRRLPRRIPGVGGGLTAKVPNSADSPHRSVDGYHGSYNDYLWQLGLADGEAVRVDVDPLDTASLDED